MSDEQAEAESLDGDKFDPQNYPPEEPLGLTDLESKDVPIAGDFAPDSLAERLDREEPDFGEPGAPVGTDDTAPGLIEPDDPFGPDLTGTAIAEGAEADGLLDGANLTEGENATGPNSNLSAEEAAVHVVADADMR